MRTVPACIVLFALLLASAAGAQPAMPDGGFAKTFPGGGGGRVALSADPLTLALADGSFRTPTEPGDGWEAFGKKDDGSYDVKPGAATSLVVRCESPAVMMLKASGHGLVYVNGEPRPGDPYSTGYLSLPVQLTAGDNTFLFRNSRGPLRAELTPPPAEVFLLTDDMTLPDLLLGRDETLPCGAVVVNATDAPVTAVPWTSRGEAPNPAAGEHARIEGAAVTLPAMSVRKIAFPVYYDGRAGGAFPITLGFGESEAARAKLSLDIKKPGDLYKRTFLSRVDGSVQYYAVQPHVPADGDGGKAYPLVLSLHGAGVEATSQAAAYAPKTWCDVVCPTNRRPYGFDWEDWGRLDAMEVLDDALLHLQSDRSRVYLTGHSMGGHGAWSLGTLYPDRFAAIAPSAGWMSFASYTGAGHRELFGRADEAHSSTKPSVEAALAADSGTPTLTNIFAGATRTSDTASRLDNLKDRNVYLLHGDADDNVPAREATDAARLLQDRGIPFAMHLEPGAGHWWDKNKEEPGADCVDWPGLFDTFARTRLPEAAEVRSVEFTTDSPAVSGTRAWVTIGRKSDPLKPARVSLRYDPHAQRVVGTTENVGQMFFNSTVPGVKHLTITAVELDEQAIRPLDQLTDMYERQADGTWNHVDVYRDSPWGGESNRGGKNVSRAGPFKAAFDHAVTLVYGSAGTPEQTAWARAKARYDAEFFYYRGNGSLPVVADSDFNPDADRDGNVVLYGNADTLKVWDKLLGGCPIQVMNDSIRVGDFFTATGGDRATVFCKPRPGSDSALVGVVGGTGLAGMRLTDNLPYFAAGVGFPDWTIFGPDALKDGYAAADAAGFFGNDWRVLPTASATRPSSE